MLCRNLNFTSTNNPTNLFVLTVSIFTHHLVPNIAPLCHLNSKQLCWTYLQHVDATHVAFTHDTTPLMELYKIELNSEVNVSYVWMWATQLTSLAHPLFTSGLHTPSQEHAYWLWTSFSIAFIALKPNLKSLSFVWYLW
jgi:hypothetical protein